MFDIGFSEMLMLAAIALIAIGPKQLPGVARAVGRLIGEFKRTIGDVTATVATAREETDKALRGVVDDVRNTIAKPPESVAQNRQSEAPAAVTPPKTPEDPS